MAFSADKIRQGAAGQGGYELEQSLRFESGDQPRLTFTPSTAGNRRTGTFSCWMKRSSNTDAHNVLFSAHLDRTVIRFTGDHLRVTDFGYSGSDGTVWSLVTNQDFRDFSGWMSIIVAYDTTQGTASNRVKLYVNGERVTSFSSETYPAQNRDTWWSSTQEHHIGDRLSYGGSPTQWFDGYLAEVHFIDGTQLTPADFGETGDYGEWKPIEVSGLTYGTNGFYLSFAGGGVMSATGGNSTATDGDYKAASFTADGTFTPSAGGYVEYLVVGGGGNGAGFGASSVSGGGGGAGGYRTGYLAVTGGTGYSITVGAATEDSVFSSITSAGGGNGGQPTPTSGGSGGGSGAASPSGAAGTSGQGNAGGTGTGTWGVTTTRSGGGGGSGGAGGNSDGTNGGAAGAGTASSITGSSVTYAAGGEGVAHTRNTAGTPGAANTGNGGGGTGGSGGNSGGAGGSGIVILRYKFQ